MRALSLFEWQALAASDAPAWEALLRENVDECIQKTATSVVSAATLDTCKPGLGLLAGVPFAVKDLFDLRGYPTHASSILPELLTKAVDQDSQLVQQLRGLGASAAFKAQMNEFAYGLSGENPHYGDCEHPFLKGCLSGGSSSGSAHAVAAGYVPLAFGTDTGGSIRLPSAWCGIFGIRWEPGYYMQGGFPLAPSFDAMGWLTRSGDEMAFVIRAWFEQIKNASAHDLQNSHASQNSQNSQKSLKGALFLPKDLILPETGRAIEQFAKQLGLEASQEFTHLRSLLPKCQFAFNVLQSREAFAIHADWLEVWGDHYSPAVKERILRAKEWTPADVDTAVATRSEITAWFAEYFESYDFLAMPICPGPTVPLAEAKPELREQTLQLTTPASLASLPALSIPVWLDARRSVGLQFIFKTTAPDVPLAILELCKSI